MTFTGFGLGGDITSVCQNPNMDGIPNRSGNTIRLTGAGFLAYFVMSAVLVIIGIVSEPLASNYGLSIEQATETFSALTFGILAGAIAAIAMPRQTDLRRLLLSLYALMCAALLVLATAPSLTVLAVALAVIGIGCGIGLAAAATTITRVHTGNRRASMLVATDACFSIAGIVMPWLAGFALISGAWHWLYAVIAMFAAGVAILAATSRFPDATDNTEDPTSKSGVWPLAAWLGIASLTLYTLGQNAVLFWLPTHLSQSAGIDIANGGALVGRYWSGMFIAQLVVTVVVLRVGSRVLLLLAAVGTALGSVPLWMTTQMTALHWLALLWGIANIGLLKLVLSFVADQLPNPSPRLISCVLLGATAGTAISPWLTSRIVSHTNTLTSLQFGTACHTLMAALLFIAVWVGRRT